MRRQPPHEIDTAGAAAGDALVYDPTTDKYGPGALPASGVASVVQGTNVTVDNTDPANPVVSASSHELLMQDGVTSPPVPIETEAGDDWLYQD